LFTFWKKCGKLNQENGVTKNESCKDLKQIARPFAEGNR